MNYEDELASIFIVSEALIYPLNSDRKSAYRRRLPRISLTTGRGVKGATQAEFTVSASPAEGVKCERCWQIKKDVGISESHPTLCGRCASVLE